MKLPVMTVNRLKGGMLPWVVIMLSSLYMIYGADEVEPTVQPSDYNNCSSDMVKKHPNVKFLGIGYNILEGNPGGQNFNKGGLDPGLKTTRPIIQLPTVSCDSGSLIHGHDGSEYLIPDNVVYIQRDGSSEVCRPYLIYGTRSYQEVLLVQIKGWMFLPLLPFAFGSSVGYKTFTRNVQEMESVYVTLKTKKVYGEGRIQTSLEGLFFTEEFARDLRRLPANYTQNKESYFDFLDDWGTHVVTEAVFGQMKHVYLQYSLSSIVYEEGREIGAGLSIGGVYKGFAASVGISASHQINFKETTTAFDGTKITSTRGSAEVNEPIEYDLMAIDEVLNKVQLPPGTQSSGTPVDTLRENLRWALEDYPGYKGIDESSDPEVYRQPLTWPDGTYAIPKTSSGCPEGGGVLWTEGGRLFDTNDETAGNRWTPEDIHLDLPIKEPSRMKMTFCTKTTPQSGNYRRQWQSGTYCLFRSGKSCPEGFENGSIFWDDQNHGNGNAREGKVPEGVYGEDTKMFFCCRRDAEASKPIILPVDHEFMLMTPTGHCQQVQGMSVSRESFLWDSAGESKVEGEYPFPGLQDPEHRNDVNITFCYYQKDLSAVTGATGSQERRRRSTLGKKNPESCEFYLELDSTNSRGAVDSSASSACFITPELMISFLLVCCTLAVNWL